MFEDYYMSEEGSDNGFDFDDKEQEITRSSQTYSK